MSKTICLYYSRTGTTKGIMERIAGNLKCEIYSFTDGLDRSGPIGWIKSGADSMKEAPDVWIEDFDGDLSVYDRIIIGMPIWAARPCIVAEGLLKKFGFLMTGEVYFVVTHLAPRSFDDAINKLDGYLPNPHKAHLSTRTMKHDANLDADVFVRSFLAD